MKEKQEGTENRDPQNRMLRLLRAGAPAGRPRRRCPSPMTAAASYAPQQPMVLLVLLRAGAASAAFLEASRACFASSASIDSGSRTGSLSASRPMLV